MSDSTSEIIRASPRPRRWLIVLSVIAPSLLFDLFMAVVASCWHGPEPIEGSIAVAICVAAGVVLLLFARLRVEMCLAMLLLFVPVQFAIVMILPIWFAAFH